MISSLKSAHLLILSTLLLAGCGEGQETADAPAESETAVEQNQVETTEPAATETAEEPPATEDPVSTGSTVAEEDGEETITVPIQPADPEAEEAPANSPQ